VILLDANLLIYAHVASLPQHEASRDWLDERLNGTARVGIPWVSVVAFLRIVTNPRVFESPEPVREAWRQARAWLDCDVVWVPHAGDRHAEVLEALLEDPGIRADLVPDAHLAALAIEHGLVLCSTDGDFARFPGLRWENPLRPRT
jgi:toxin-antitoxin system PIN domain toxin